MKESLYEKLQNALIDGLAQIKIAKEDNKEKYWFWKKHDNYPKLDFFDSGMPNFSLYNYEKINYASYLSSEEVYTSIKSWKDYHEFVISNQNLCEFFLVNDYLPEGRKSLNPDFWNKLPTYYFLGYFTDSYVHNHGFEFVEEKYSDEFNKYYNSLLIKKLPINVIIPILFISFDFEIFELNDRISIQRIDETIQLSRNQRVSNKYSAHPTVTGAATHAFVLKNWEIDNSNGDPFSSPLSDINSYRGEPLTIINQLFASLRIANPNIESGFCQIVAAPIEWQHSFYQGLRQTFVASEKNYPNHFEDYGWLQEMKILQIDDAKKIKQVYDILSSSKYLDLAYKRLNKASLNCREDDSIIDIAIALEAVLTNDSNTEITYRLSTRAALLNKLLPFKGYSNEHIFSLCKKIYDFRSSVVHGDTKRYEKSKMIKVHTEEGIPTVNIGLALLKHVLWVLINNSNIDKPSAIDKYLFE